MPIFLILFIGTVLAIQIMLKKNKIDFGDTLDKMMKKEIEANCSRKKDIDQEFFITPAIDKLPFKEYPNFEEYKDLTSAQNLVKKKAGLKMLKFDSPISNTDLKIKYGFSNLENITIYEEHYNSYIHALINWAKLLKEKENLSDAEIILNEALNIKCDLSLAYTLLADIYSEKNNKEKLKELKETVEASNIILKNKIINHIEKLL